MNLSVQQIVRVDGRPHRVAMVNECRAFCVPLAKKVVSIKPLVGKPIAFEKTERGVSIAPNSNLPVLGLALPDGSVVLRNGKRVSVEQFLACEWENF